MLRSLRAQLSLSILIVLLTTVALISVCSNWIITRKFEDYITRQEAERSQSIVGDLSAQYNSLTRGWDPIFLHTIGMYSLYDGYLLQIYGADGTVLWDAENHDTSLCGQIMEEISQRMADAQLQGEFVTNTYPILEEQAVVGGVSVTYYGPFFFTENDYLFIKTLNTVLLTIGLSSAAFAVVAGSLLASRITRPVAKTAYISTQIAQGNYNIRFEGKPGTRELSDMASAVNQLAEALSEQEHLRKRLTSDVAHELRTPLSAVRAHLEAMMTGLWEPTPQRLQSCYDEIKRLGTLVADLERLAKMEDGNLKLQKSRIDLYELAQGAVQSLEPQAFAKQQTLLATGTSVWVEADAERLMQVLINLVSNAVRYTPQGGELRVETGEETQWGTLSVWDNGVGISPQELPFIFERFYRTDQSRNRETGGTGIGLTIAKSIVEAHGGRLEVESTPGVGSCFTAFFPKQSV